ncbi:helix-turn-helix transcriptional regulator [Bradyrhizobium sp. AUGA SZCCT0240]|uniref:helix-turn-helix domain-containing protein n=1 Tax=unclassified Bradyrhizobium TaxID=2631580 RepID=UPI001BAA63C7|nr:MULTISPECIES: helix-turn-helix transcriptional regulator [unclassified Bradyrhizobium]MBR1197134.1 helix-turn-helix transcriptional regulator [Bradyrhizobium sp. AUGA SZCCT0158]MBR1240061.1 helix-turn-helix transcriptional regulator [Bradyrhizobium sp. AUGA SZCCT0274]MBR1248124.1 helix-turn-helix transcriptional regulator [Bradyrhizobium sp. AUGA SZCCT0169]MBR1254044.1 helix-turn-helix transcriptional regulator [Bradyrhizobium sp. AUGA SZCCT0240]
MSKSTDGQIDQLVKARWLALGLSQNDLAEVLAGQPTPKANNGSGRVSVGRLMQVADALGVSHDLFEGLSPSTRPQKPQSGNASADTMQALLELRLLRVFRELQDNNTKRMLIQLAEQIVKRQAAGPDEAG